MSEFFDIIVLNLVRLNVNPILSRSQVCPILVMRNGRERVEIEQRWNDGYRTFILFVAHSHTCQPVARERLLSAGAHLYALRHVTDGQLKVAQVHRVQRCRMLSSVRLLKYTAPTTGYCHNSRYSISSPADTLQRPSTFSIELTDSHIPKPQS